MPPRRLSLPDSAAVAEGTDARRSAPSAERNAAPILAELLRRAPERGRALELASGTGQHVARFAAALPGLDWQPSDGNPDALASIAAWAADAALPNLRPPILLDAAAPGWADRHNGYDLILAVNLLHLISSPEALRVLGGIGAALARGGLALIYGPFRRDGTLTSEGDRRFDAALRAQDPDIGYKDSGEVARWAVEAGLSVEDRAEMPANNLLLAFRRPL